MATWAISDKIQHASEPHSSYRVHTRLESHTGGVGRSRAAPHPHAQALAVRATSERAQDDARTELRCLMDLGSEADAAPGEESGESESSSSDGSEDSGGERGLCACVCALLAMDLLGLCRAGV